MICVADFLFANRDLPFWKKKLGIPGTVEGKQLAQIPADFQPKNEMKAEPAKVVIKMQENLCKYSSTLHCKRPSQQAPPRRPAPAAASVPPAPEGTLLAQIPTDVQPE